MKIFFRGPTFFERLLCYFLMPDLMAKIVYEIILKAPPITITQPKQFLFYGLVAIEYIVVIMRFRSFRPSWVNLHPISVLLVVMALHGLVVGFWWGNSGSRMAIDSVNVLVVLANIIVLSDPHKIADTAFDRVFFLNRLYGVVMVLLSAIAIVVNPASVISLGGATATAISMSIIFAELFLFRHLSVRTLVNGAIGLALLMATVQGWNRTTLVFFGVAILILFARRARKMPFRVAYLALASVLISFVALSMLPEESALSRRLAGLGNVDLSERTGSIGEREAEADAVDDKIAGLGVAGQLFGAGHGASYDVKYTWEWKLNYSNAHYGWVLFYLRYGALGYLYMALWICALLVSLLNKWRSPYPASIIVCLLSVWNIGYLGTYGYFSFFIAGVPFVRPAIRGRPTGDHGIAGFQERRLRPLTSREAL